MSAAELADMEEVFRYEAKHAKRGDWLVITPEGRVNEKVCKTLAEAYAIAARLDASEPHLVLHVGMPRTPDEIEMDAFVEAADRVFWAKQHEYVPGKVLVVTATAIVASYDSDGAAMRAMLANPLHERNKLYIAGKGPRVVHV